LNEELSERCTKADKDLSRLREDNKELKVYQETILSELQNLKTVMKDKSGELKQVKSECAAALMGKEKKLHHSLVRLETQVSDLQFENQKYVQALHDKEIKAQEDIDGVKETLQETCKEKDRTIKQLKT